MGINNYHSWLRKKFPKLIFPISDSSSYQTNNLYIDLNFCLHFCAYGVGTIPELYKKLMGFINYIILYVNPDKSITLTADGAATYAKLNLQRKRRQTMIRNLTIDGIKEINPLLFTPGTKFMSTFNEKMQNHIENDLMKKYPLLQFYNTISGPNEAEYKVFEQIKNDKHNETHVLISNDADVILMGMSLENYKNISIVTRFNKLFEVIDIGKLFDYFKKDCEFVNNYDIVFLSLLSGNDYFPKVNFVTQENIWDIYKKNKSNIVKPDKLEIDFKTLRNILSKFNNNAKKSLQNRFSIFEFNGEQYKNYLECLIWCFRNYTDAKCENYECMYNYQHAPHPFGLVLALYYYKEIGYPKGLSEPIPDEVYASLALPKCAYGLCTSDMSETIKEDLGYLFEEEECKKCAKYNLKIHNLQTKIKCVFAQEDEELEETKNKLLKSNRKYHKHKKQHKDLTHETLKKAINVLVEAHNKLVKL